VGSLAVAIGLALLSGALQVLIFPHFSFPYMAVFAIVPLLLATAEEPRASRRFLLGWMAGCVFWGGSCYWIYAVMHDYADLSGPAAAAIFVGFFLAKGLHMGVFATLAGPAMRRPWALAGVAALWVAIEGTHQYLGFTWLQLGNAAASMEVVARLAPFAGVYGPSFVLAAINVGLALLIMRRPRLHWAGLALLPALFLLPKLPDGETGDRYARLVQPAVNPNSIIDGWTPTENQAHLRMMEELSTGGDVKPDLLIWPEYSVPLYYFDVAGWPDFMAQIAQAVDAPLIFNAIAFKEIDGVRRPLNSALTLDASGELVGRYAKMHLVPFGEFVPWPFSAFIDKITLQSGDFTPGDESAVSKINGHQVGVYICYENAFASGVRQFTANGAEVLVNISNDGWYGATAARYQHLLLARMRAIENQRWILRATADGITTSINRAGQITQPLPSFEPGAVTAGFSYSAELSFYARWGDWFWWLCAAISMTLLQRKMALKGSRTPSVATSAKSPRATSTNAGDPSQA
jgi:apolipoprotein N-acyltransferase